MFRGLHRLIRRGFSTSAVLSSKSPLAFTFDIDGVLIRGSKGLSYGTAALKLLQHHNVPFILLTNGGGKKETERAEQLSNLLSVDIAADQLIQSHTPVKKYSSKYNRVLVVGGPGDKSRHVALDYGFKDVVIPVDIIKTRPSIWPFHRYTAEELDKWGEVRDFYNEKEQNEGKIDAIFVFNDSRDVGSDVQIILDLLLSQHGRLGTRRDLHKYHFNSGAEYQRLIDEPSIPILFTNQDFLWANDYPIPRFGQGALKMMIERLYEAATGGGKLISTTYGKPFPVTYQYADGVLREWAQKRCGMSRSEAEAISDIYMVGDNPESDILGANTYGWHSVLLRTGVFKDEDLPTLSREKIPEVISNNVQEAVEQILLKHGY